MEKTIKRVLAFLAVFTLFFTGLALPTNTKVFAEEDQALEKIKERGVLKVAIFGDLPPYGYTDEKGNLVGYSVRIAEKLAEELLGDASKLDIEAVNAEERVEVLNSDRVDIVLANFTKTPEREKVVDFADPYMKVAIGIASKKDNLVTDPEQLKGETVIVTKGTTAEVLFTKEHPDVKLDKYEAKNQEFQALLDGRGIALADDNSYLFPWVKEHPDFEVGIKEFGDIDTINPAVKKGNESIVKFINESFAKWGKEGYFEDLYEKELAPFFGDSIQPSDILVDDHLVNE